MPRQYVACQFAGAGRAYTYHWDGEPLPIGTTVKVQARGGGEAFVEVVSIEKEPPFPTKPVLGLAPPKEGALL